MTALTPPTAPHPTVPTPWGDESEVVTAVLDWAVRRVRQGQDPRATAKPAAELAAATGPTVTATGIGGHRALSLFDEVLVPSTRAHEDPLNLAYVPSAPTRAAVAFELATSAANIFAGMWESGAGAIHAENQVLAWIAELLGWPSTAAGCFVSGGTLGNLSALVAARSGAEQRREQGGLRPVPDQGWLLACTADAHSSVRAAARVMGVELLEVAGDHHGRLTGSALRAALGSDLHERVFAVVASAGTTNAGIVDDLDGVSKVCRERAIWLHVDGAYGGAALAAPSVRHLFRGIEHADSFIVDPHKWLFAPYDSCALVYRDPAVARRAHSQHASYLDQVDRESPNPADLAMHLTRRPRGLPLWFSLAVHGTDAYRDAVEQSLATARIVADAVRERAYLRLVLQPDLSVLLFERMGWSQADYEAWSRLHALAGHFLCVPTRWRGAPVLRMAFVNPATSPDAVVRALDTLAEPGTPLG